MTSITSAAYDVQPVSPPASDEAMTGEWHEAVRRFKRVLVEQALAQSHGNRTHAARTLGLQRTYLLRLITISMSRRRPRGTGCAASPRVRHPPERGDHGNHTATHDPPPGPGHDPAPQSGSAAAIFRTRATISALTGGRPRVGRAESLAQCSRKRRRCQRRTVSGVTNTRDCLQSCPDPGQPNPEEAIRRAQPGPAKGSLVHGDLVTQGEILEGKVAVAAAEEGEETKQVEQEGDH